MNLIMKSAYGRFHGYAYSGPGIAWRPYVETTETKHFFVQEREVSYRIHLHQHPYVVELARRLIRRGTPGLQAADTEYVAANASLPASIEVAVPSNSALSASPASRIAMLADVQGTAAGGVPIQLGANMELALAGPNASQIALVGNLRALLSEGMAETPGVGEQFQLAQNKEAVALEDAKISLMAATSVLLHDGTVATIPAATEVLLQRNARIAIPSGSQVRLMKSKARPVLYEDFFGQIYKPNPELVRLPYPVLDLDFTSSGAYSLYNWELFYHVPITIAIHLSKNQRFAEAQRWFHFLFDPTDDSDGPTPERFWKVRPFQYTDVKKVEEILVNLATGTDEELREETVNSIKNWQDNPFRPHVIARYRQQAYMYKTVMAYLDNLIAWGDSLFRQDTGEAIDEATMIYVLAANILGPRPLPVPKKGQVRAQTYDNLRRDLKEFGVVMRDVESDLPFDLMPFPAEGGGDESELATVRALGKALYFCVPRNDQLLQYWDTMADRLFKIHNSLNIQGVFRQLALFEPPIDPALLARAAAAGLDVAAIVNGLNQPLPLVRFQLLVQKAAEITQEVKSLGSGLLSAMEKEEGEAMAILRAKHERVIMEMVEHVKYGQLQEAIKSKEGLHLSLALAVQRYTYYEKLLDRKPEEIEKATSAAVQALGELDRENLNRMKFSMKEPQIGAREIEVDIAQDLQASGGKLISSHEATELGKLSDAQTAQDVAAVLGVIGGFMNLMPQIGANIKPFGVGAHLEIGGPALSNMLGMAADVSRAFASKFSYDASLAAKIGSYARREQDWAYQSNLAVGEIGQTLKQLRGAQLREAIAELELKNHRQQMKHAGEIEEFLNGEGSSKTGKKTNKALYAWMKREVKGLYAQCFQFAFDVARKAERALQHELGNRELRYLQFGYLAGKEGLLAGERLHLDLKRMELAYHELNQREYELTKHVSLLQVDPIALVQLRATGRCTVRLHESMFDMDGPGHYFRRIKTVALSIPCVAGPYASVNCTLRLLKSSIRKTSVFADEGYAREEAEDERFEDYFGSVQSIVTSSAQNDSGLFETNLRDERYLPFEYSGAESEWRLELPANPSLKEPAQFDYATISDVILHIRYTAREGGALLRKGALEELGVAIAAAQAAGSVRLFSVRHEFPTEWASFNSVAIKDSVKTSALTIKLRDEHYPFWSKTIKKEIKSIEVLTRTDEVVRISDNSAGAGAKSLEMDASLGNRIRRASVPDTAFPDEPTGTLTLYFDKNNFDESTPPKIKLDDVWLVMVWGEES